MKPKFTDSTRYANGYRSAVDTDIKATFRRIERENKAKAEREAANAIEASTKTISLKARKA